MSTILPTTCLPGTTLGLGLNRTVLNASVCAPTVRTLGTGLLGAGVYTGGFGYGYNGAVVAENNRLSQIANSTVVENNALNVNVTNLGARNDVLTGDNLSL